MRGISVRIAVVGLMCSAVALIGNPVVLACTAFCSAGAGKVLVGNNEDWTNPRIRSRTMYLYYFHDFERVVTFHLDDELKQGPRILDIPALFPRNVAAESFAARQKEGERAPSVAVAITLVVLPCTAMAIAAFAVLRAGRRFRIGLAMSVAVVALIVVLGAVTLHMQRPASADWTEFSIGPASGESASIQPGAMRADGITLKVALATAYDMPAVRVIGPSWLNETRYSINAVAGLDAPDSFRSLLQQELQNRLRLDTHVEVRPFDVFVLTSTEALRLEPSHGKNTNTWIHQRDAQLQDASMERLASALQVVLGRPVIDETGITGSYDLEFGWGEDRVASVTTTLRDQFGLRLSPGKRDMEALIVDGIRRDAALVLLEHVGRLTRGVPSHYRRRIADILTIH